MGGKILFSVNNSTGPLIGLQPVFFSNGSLTGTQELSLTYDPGFMFFQAMPLNGNGEFLQLPGGRAMAIQEAIDNTTNTVEMQIVTSDGTAAGTTDLVLSTGGGNNKLGGIAVVVNGKALLSSTETPVSGQQETVQFVLTDGTSAGTSTFTVAGPAGGFSADFSDAVSNGHKAFFAGAGADGNLTLWVSDGTKAGTAPINSASIANAFIELGPSNLDVFKNGVLFEGVDSDGNAGLWFSNGSASGTVEVLATVDNEGTIDQLRPVDITTVGQLAFFSANSSLWVTNGTKAGTTSLPISGVDNVSDLTPLGDRAVFNAMSFGNDLAYISDGTEAGTFALSTVAESPNDFTRVGGKIFFEAIDAANHKGLWVTDGTVAGTKELQISGADSSGIFGPGGFTTTNLSINMAAAGNLLYFEGLNSSGLVGLWVSDGTTAGTVQVAPDSAIHISGISNLQLTGVAPEGDVLTDREDFNADGRADILIQNAAGSVVAGELGRTGAETFTTLAGLGSEWKFVGNGDFFGVGETDALIENSAGAVFTLEHPASGTPQFKQVSALGPEWKFVGTGDFLGNGHDQFLIENSAGAVDVGDAISGAAAFTSVAALGPEWKFVGAGDFLGNARTDFLIENTSGAVVVGDVSHGQTTFTTVTALGSEWKFVGAGDFLGEGHDQFLIENTSGSVVVADVVNGHAVFTTVTGLGPEWRFEGAGDYLGEGHDQFLVENTAGAVFVGDYVGGQTHFVQLTALGPEWVFHS